ncbi:MAG TPA: hypothetical protein VH858_18640 [Hyphomicrobiales bacterium]|jgi:hypothetical protein
MSVYIAYILKDKHLAEDLAASLRAQKFDVQRLRPVDLAGATTAAMRRAKANVFLWTPNSSGNAKLLEAAKVAELYGNYVPAYADIASGGPHYTKFTSNINQLYERVRGLGAGPGHVPPWEAFIVYAVLIAAFVLLYAYLNSGNRPEAIAACDDRQMTTPLSDPETPINVRPCPMTRY